MIKARIRMLCFVRETFPTFRPDIEVLFGHELLSRGHQIDLVMQAGRETESVGPRSWHGRTVWVGATDSRTDFLHRLHRHCLAVWHDFRSLRHARAQDYDAVQARDKLIRGVLFSWLLYRWILPRCDHAFVQSEQMRHDVAAHGIDLSKLTSVPMGIAASDAQTPRRPVADGDFRTSALTLAYLGTLDSQRRLEVLVEMLALLRNAGIAAHLQLIGDAERPEERLRLERRAVDLGVLDYLQITGFLPREAALARVRDADIALSPFYPTPVLRSTSPTKLVEYLALGLPVVANDHPEQRRVLRDSGAGVCVPWGARYFARGVRWLAGRAPAERERMGASGRDWVLAHRTYTRIADQLEQEYLELLSRPGR